MPWIRSRELISEKSSSTDNCSPDHRAESLLGHLPPFSVDKTQHWRLSKRCRLHVGPAWAQGPELAFLSLPPKVMILPSQRRRMLTQSSTTHPAPPAQESSLMKTLGLEKILMASSIWESFLSSSTRLFCMLRLSARIGSITRSFIS